MFVIEDEIHAEWQGQYATFEEALLELRRRATLPWDQAPNAPPCTSWDTCERDYVVIEFDTTGSPWREIRRVPMLQISASGVRWGSGFPSPDVGIPRGE